MNLIAFAAFLLSQEMQQPIVSKEQIEKYVLLGLVIAFGFLVMIAMGRSLETADNVPRKEFDDARWDEIDI